MKREFDLNSLSSGRLLPGLILIGVGLLVLVSQLGGGFTGNVIGALMFGALAYYLYSEGRRRRRMTLRLLALPAAGLALAALLPGSFGGALFLALIGLAFAFVWRSDQTRWWAIIPAGTFASLAATASLGPLSGRLAGFVFLLGLGATFYVLTRLRVDPQGWAIYPAGALGLLAVISLMGGGGGWLLPLVLVAAGVLLLARGGLSSGPPAAAEQAPAEPRQEAGIVVAKPAEPAPSTEVVRSAGASDAPGDPAAPAGDGGHDGTPDLTTGAG